MAVNNEFYTMINALVNGFTKGFEWTSQGRLDYNSFIDVGKTLNEKFTSDVLQNGFLLPLINKVQATVDTYRGYDPVLMDMYQGESDFGIVEIIAHTFYNVRQAPFINLQNTEDDSMIDFKKPEIAARYYTDTNSWQSYISVSDTELRGAFRSPAAMDGFIQSLLGDMANTNKLYREVSRLNNIAGAIGAAFDAQQAAGGTVKVANKTGTYIDLLAVYKALYSDKTALTEDSALQDPEFVRWAVSYINMYKRWMEKPNNSMNEGKILTFTPQRDQKTKISSLFDSAIRRSLWDIYHTEGALLGDYEVLPFWQSTGAPMRVVANEQDSLSSASGPSEEGNTYGNILAVVYDNYSLMEYKDYQSVSTERNNKKLYNTYYYNFAYRYIRNGNANFVAFALGNVGQH